MKRTIAILTDFGLADHYAGVMKGVIADIAPDATVTDISHAVPPQDVLRGQRMLKSSVPYFPKQTVFLAVVDPGVGTERRPLAVFSKGYYFVGPDNGLFTPWLEGNWRAVQLTSEEHRLADISSTFHGRDVFAPAAAHLAIGVSLSDLGPPVTDPVRADPQAVEHRPDGSIAGEIAHIDSFGNLISNIPLDRPIGTAVFRDRRLSVLPAYGSAAAGALLALIGSDSTLEIAISGGHAASALNVAVGEPLVWKPT